MTASDFIFDVFFIFSIIKNFRHKKRRFMRKKSTSGKPALLARNVYANAYEWRKVLRTTQASGRICVDAKTYLEKYANVNAALQSTSSRLLLFYGKIFY